MKRIILAVCLFALLVTPAVAANPQRGIAMACGDIQVPKAFGIVGWFHLWNHATAKFADPLFVPMIRCRNDVRTGYPCTSLDTLAIVANQAATNPSRYWLLGNDGNGMSSVP